MRLFKNKFIHLLAIGTLSLSIASCFGGGSGQESSSKTSKDPNTSLGSDVLVTDDVTIRFYGWGSTTEEAIYQELVEDFMELYPNIIVQYSCFSPDIYMNTLMSSASNLPDLFYMPDEDFMYWASNGALWDFKDYISQEEIESIWEEGLDRYYFDEDTYLVGYSEDASLYGLPKDLGPFTIAYNVNLMKNALEYANKNGISNLTYEEAKESYLNDEEPMTFDDFVELSKILKPYMDTRSGYVLSHYEVDAAIYSNNASYFNDDVTEQTMDQKQFVDTWQWLHDLAFEHKIMPDGASNSTTNGYQLFMSGNSIFSFVGPWDLAAIWGTTSTSDTIRFDIQLLPVPYGPGADGVYDTEDDGVSQAWVGSMGYVISGKRTSNMNQRLAALMLAKFLCFNEDAQRKFYRLGQQVPNLIDMATGEFLELEEIVNYKGENVKVNPSNLKVFLDIMDGVDLSKGDKIGGIARPTVHTYNTDWDLAFTTALDEVHFWTDKNVTGQDLINYFKGKMQDYLDEYSSYR